MIARVTLDHPSIPECNAYYNWLDTVKVYDIKNNTQYSILVENISVYNHKLFYKDDYYRIVGMLSKTSF